MQCGGICLLPGDIAQKQDRSLRHQGCCHLPHYLGALPCGDWAPTAGSARAPWVNGFSPLTPSGQVKERIASNLLLSPPRGGEIREGVHEKRSN